MYLDDVQFSKGSYTNRVQVAVAGAPRWLTLPVSHTLGDPIDCVTVAKPDIARAHLDILRPIYREARHRVDVWPVVERLLLTHDDKNLARRNEALIQGLAERLGLATRFVRSSEVGHVEASADERLSRIVETLAPGGIYLSGPGARAYQSEAPFAARGLTLRYSSFAPAPYERGGVPFVPGLSILDAIFHLGFDATRDLLIP